MKKIVKRKLASKKLEKWHKKEKLVRDDDDEKKCQKSWRGARRFCQTVTSSALRVAFSLSVCLPRQVEKKELEVFTGATRHTHTHTHTKVFP